jgi:hypothetical protein
VTTPDQPGPTEDAERPLLSALHESGSTLESAAPSFDEDASAARLRRAGEDLGLLLRDSTLEEDLTRAGHDLEDNAPPFEIEADANAIKTAAHDLGLLGNTVEHWTRDKAADNPELRVVPADLSREIRAGSGRVPRETPHWIPYQSESHERLLDSSHRSSGRAQFDAILVPASRPVGTLRDCIGVALETAIPLIVVCSKRVNKHQVVDLASRENVEVIAVDLPQHPANPLGGISFATSTEEDILAASSGLTRDLSTKHNLGLIIARMLRWQRIMFLDDDIYGVSKNDVDALAAALDDHHVSVLIPEEYPDNSVARHAHRLGGGQQGKFASAAAMGVRCDRDDLAFFPNIYNEDWFFFSDEAASHRIAPVGASRQRKYDPYADPQRAAKEEFGDLLAEGLYARLDAHQDIPGIDTAYWANFIESRQDFLGRVAQSLTQHPDSELDNQKGQEVRAAQVSIRAAQGQLQRISPDLCQKFVDLWYSDLAEWRHYLTMLPQFDSVVSALDHLGLDYAVSSPSTR